MEQKTESAHHPVGIEVPSLVAITSRRSAQGNSLYAILKKTTNLYIMIHYQAKGMAAKPVEINLKSTEYKLEKEMKHLCGFSFSFPLPRNF